MEYVVYLYTEFSKDWLIFDYNYLKDIYNAYNRHSELL